MEFRSFFDVPYQTRPCVGPSVRQTTVTRSSHAFCTYGPRVTWAVAETGNSMAIATSKCTVFFMAADHTTTLSGVSRIVCSIAVLLATAPSLEGARADAPSLSLGTPGKGKLKRGRKLPLKGRGYRVIPQTRDRGFVYGTSELIGLIKRTGARVGRKTKSTLAVGNLSRKGGGDIPQSVTHNSGRDVDLLFFALDSDGEPIRVGFIGFDRSLESKWMGEKVTFDVARNWTVVETLLRDGKAQVHSILVARWLKKPLLAHAKKIRAPKWIRGRAKAVLHQPARSASHSDHFHVRIACAKHERLEGCLNAGRLPDWVRTWDADVQALVEQLQRDITSTDADKAVAAMKRIGRLRADSAAPKLAEALSDKRPTVRAAALRTLEEVRAVDGARDQLVEAAKTAGPGLWRMRLLRTLARKTVPELRDLLVAVLRDRQQTREGSREAAARGLGALKDPTTAPALIEALSDTANVVRSSAHRALKRLTQHDFGGDKSAIAAWREWHSQFRDRRRIDWLIAAFSKSARIPDPAKKCRTAVRKLVRQIRKGGDTAENARAVIAHLTGYQARRTLRGKKRTHRHYRRWLRKGGHRKCKHRPAHKG